jgi:hypothetical protein
MTKRYDNLPPGMMPRGLTRNAAAAFVGLSPNGFAKARKDGMYPAPTLPGGRYDRVKLDEAMNLLSGLIDERTALKPLDSWRSRARKA